MASQIACISIVCTTVCSGAGHRKHQSSAPRHWLCEGNSPVTGEFPSQTASNVENVSIRWPQKYEVHLDMLSAYYSRLVFHTTLPFLQKNYFYFLWCLSRIASVFNTLYIIGTVGQIYWVTRPVSITAYPSIAITLCKQSWTYFANKTMTYHKQVTWVFFSLIELTRKKTPKLRMASPLRDESIGDRWIPLIIMQKAFITSSWN